MGGMIAGTAEVQQLVVTRGGGSPPFPGPGREGERLPVDRLTHPERRGEPGRGPGRGRPCR